jgi:hypothetical protein
MDDDMNVLIEDTERSLFLAAGDKWTPFHELAYDFNSTIAASDWCKGKPERRFVVYLAFDDERYDLRLDPGYFTPSHNPKIPLPSQNS